jgi:hypothetical protein
MSCWCDCMCCGVKIFEAERARSPKVNVVNERTKHKTARKEVVAAKGVAVRLELPNPFSQVSFNYCD